MPQRIEVNGGSKTRIIVINDDTDFLTLMSELLMDVEGYDVQVCRESQNAYRFVKEYQPDLVVLDIRMDGQESGWAILECLTLDPATADIPVIVCSAAIRELRAHAGHLERQGIRALPKPFGLDDLLAMVADSLEKRAKR
ncbi:MAG: two-component system response regulator [Chloroflexota bacterium]